MATYPSTTRLTVPNFPQPLNRVEENGYTFPSDIVNGEQRNFYTQIQFLDWLGNTPSGSVKLPIPVKVDDNFVLSWSEVNLTDSFASKAASVPGVAFAGTLLGYATGTALNPFMFMMFQKPELRQFSLSWVLSPRNQKESEAVKNIITKCKQAAAPTRESFFLIGYPNYLMIKMHPDDLFGHMVFKPCVITSVQVNYTGGGTPSFFKKTSKGGAPTIITLTLNLKEIYIWYREEIT